MFGKRLKELRLSRGLNQSTVAAYLGVSQQAVGNYEAGKREPDTEALQRLATYFDVSLDYLLGRSGDPRTTLEAILGDQLVNMGEMVPVPILGRVAAGEPLYADQHVEGVQMTPKSDIEGGEYFWLRVSGDSMLGAHIREGDLVLVRRQECLENGQIGVVVVNGDEATIKRVYVNGGQCVLMPENPAYQPKVYPAREVQIVGEAITVIHRLNGR